MRADVTTGVWTDVTFELIHRATVSGGGGDDGVSLPVPSPLSLADWTAVRGGSTPGTSAPHYPSIIDRRAIRVATWQGSGRAHGPGQPAANDRTTGPVPAAAPC